ncbi:MAG TPA: ABC transporter permease [Mycobacteriales bacterium]|jgi:ABC-2 type transport system permease protein|nr:ABC transporter permease [Mycobacteriales bacterium]
MPERGTHRQLGAVPPPSAPDARTGAAAGYRPGRTLRLRVELRRQLLRRRTTLAFGFLLLLPLLLVGAFSLGSDSSGGNAPGLVDLATRGALNFTLFTLFASTGFLLVVIVALFVGDTVAVEASWSSLRYQLTLPVPRSRLLRQKLLVGLGLSLLAVVLLPAAAYLAGGIFFGWAPVQLPLGGTLSTGTGLARLCVIVGYLAVTLLFVASLGFFLGVCTDAPLGAVGGAVLIVILSNILDAVTALGSVRNALPTHWSYAWTDALADRIVWSDMAAGAACSLSYAVLLLAAAWLRFARKDITS